LRGQNNLLIKEWDRDHPWINICKEYFTNIDKNIDDLEEIGKDELRQCINRKDEQDWKEDM